MSLKERKREIDRARKRYRKELGEKNCLGKSKNGQGHLNKKIISIVKQVYSFKEGRKEISRLLTIMQLLSPLKELNNLKVCMCVCVAS